MQIVNMTRQLLSSFFIRFQFIHSLSNAASTAHQFHCTALDLSREPQAQQSQSQKARPQEGSESLINGFHKSFTYLHIFEEDTVGWYSTAAVGGPTVFQPKTGISAQGLLPKEAVSSPHPLQLGL